MREPCACGWEDCGHFRCSGCGLMLLMPIREAANHVADCDKVDPQTRRFAHNWIESGYQSSDG